MLGRPGSFFTGAPFALLVSEAVCLGASLRLFRRRQVPVWIKVPALAVHFWLWIAILWSEPVIWFSPLHARILILAVLPVSALIFTLRKEQVAFHGGTRPPGLAWGIAALTLVGVGSLWIPAWGGRLSRMKNLGAMTLELSRGPCYGPCPLYRITLRGDGRVQFVGKRPYSRVETTESGMINNDKVALILRTLDGVDFMTLDGRAFVWAFDTPSVAVQVSTGERTKLVVSDAGFVGAATGRQARFVEAARKIDAILMSAKWDTCEGDCGPSNSLQ